MLVPRFWPATAEISQLADEDGFPVENSRQKNGEFLHGQLLVNLVEPLSPSSPSLFHRPTDTPIL
jgi:hypothetical protein